MPRSLTDLGLVLAMSPSLSHGEVLDAEVRQSRDGTWSCDVVLYSDPYETSSNLDRWEIHSKDGTLIASHALVQAETLEEVSDTLEGIEIPDTVEQVTLRAHDKVKGYVGNPIALKLRRLV